MYACVCVCVCVCIYCNTIRAIEVESLHRRAKGKGFLNLKVKYIFF